MSSRKFFSLSQPYDLTRFYRVEMSVMYDIRELLVFVAKSGEYDSYLDVIVAFLDETDDYYFNARKDSKKLDYSVLLHNYGKEEIKDK